MSLPKERTTTRGNSDAGSAASDFPLIPYGWYYAGPVEALRKPVEIILAEREYVAFAVDRQPVVLAGRCPHFSARLSRGRVVDGCLQCPLHAWRFRPDGSCAGTPSGETPPAAARLAAFPVTMLGGHVFFHTDSCNRSAVPFFADQSPSELISAPAFRFEVEMPWWLVSANGFDAQHFLSAHDRRLVGIPEVQRADDVFEARAVFDVVGDRWRDRVTRRFSGPRVEMTVRHVGGTMVLVTSRFRRSVTYGLVSIHPCSPSRSLVHTIVWIPRRTGAARVVDPLDVRVRANFIRAFLGPDISAGEGIRFDPARTVAADALLVRYLGWVGAREHA